MIEDHFYSVILLFFNTLEIQSYASEIISAIYSLEYLSVKKLHDITGFLSISDAVVWITLLVNMTALLFIPFEYATTPKRKTTKPTFQSSIQSSLQFISSKLNFFRRAKPSREAYSSFIDDGIEEIKAQKEEIEAQADHLKSLYHDLVSKNKELSTQKAALEESYANFEHIAQIGREITKEISFEKVLSIIYKDISDVIPLDIIFLGIAQGEKMKFHGLQDGEQPLQFERSLHEDHLMGIWCFKKDQTFVLNDYEKDYTDIIPGTIPAKFDKMPGSAIFHPLRSGDQLFGVIAIFNYDKNVYSQKHTGMISNLSVFIVNALEHAALYREVDNQKQKAETLNSDYLSGIGYAHKVQKAIMGNRDYITKQFIDSFIMLRPRDTVSGDFYWFWEHNEYKVIACADCTGHGIPGAFFSIMGIDFLNEIAVENGCFENPHTILEHLDQKIEKALHSDNQLEETYCGMDIGSVGTR